MEHLDARIDALHLDPGDIVAVRCLRRITREHAEEIRAQMEGVVGDHPVLILPPDLELMVVRYPLETLTETSE